MWDGFSCATMHRERDAPLELGISRVRLQASRLLELRHRIGQASAVGQRPAEVHPGSREVGVDLQCLLEGRQTDVGLAKRHQGHAESIVRGCKPRLDPY